VTRSGDVERKKSRRSKLIYSTGRGEMGRRTHRRRTPQIARWRAQEKMGKTCDSREKDCVLSGRVFSSAVQSKEKQRLPRTRGDKKKVKRSKGGNEKTRNMREPPGS